MSRIRPMVLLVALALGVTALGACSSDKSSEGDADAATVEVSFTSEGCPETLEAPAGKVNFKATNDGAANVTEFEILDGDSILGEAENITPGLTKTFTVGLEGGREYVTYCPNGTEREKGTLVVTGEGGQTEAAAPECMPTGDPATADTTVDVTLDEWVLKVEPGTAPAGTISFAATDTGAEAHEMVLIKGVAPNDLPLAEDGSLDEEQLPEGALIGEIEPFPAGEDCQATFALEAGEYTLLCNIVETEGEHVGRSHVKEGMVTVFTVI